MARTDRGVRRARRHLTPDEIVIASAMALEEEGRRRQVVVVTDRRVLITGLRDDTSVEFPLDGSTCRYQRTGGRLSFVHEDRELTVREIDEVAGRNILMLLEARTTRRTAQAAVRAGRPEFSDHA